MPVKILQTNDVIPRIKLGIALPLGWHTEFSGTGGDWATHIDKVNYANLTQQ